MRFKAFGDNAMERVVWSFGLLWLKKTENKGDRTFLFSLKKVIHQKEEKGGQSRLTYLSQIFILFFAGLLS